MKKETSINHKTRCFFYALLALVLCVECDGTSLTEQIGKDVRNIQSEFEKGYKQQDTSWTSVDTVIIDTTIIRAIEQGNYKYYRVRFVGTNEPTLKVIYYVSDSLSVGN